MGSTQADGPLLGSEACGFSARLTSHRRQDKLVRVWKNPAAAVFTSERSCVAASACAESVVLRRTQKVDDDADAGGGGGTDQLVGAELFRDFVLEKAGGVWRGKVLRCRTSDEDLAGTGHRSSMTIPSRRGLPAWPDRMQVAELDAPSPDTDSAPTHCASFPAGRSRRAVPRGGRRGWAGRQAFALPSAR